MIPFTPHLAYECLELLKCDTFNKWPDVNKNLQLEIKFAIQINGKTTSEDIAAEVSKSVLSTNGHKGKIDVQTFQVLEVLGGGDFFDSAGKTFVLNTEAQGSFIKFTQATASIDGNKIKKYFENQKVIKTIFVKNKIINYITSKQ